MDDLTQYRTAAKEHGKCSLSGESDLANEAYAKLQEAFHALIAKGEDASICDLYDDPDLWVQLWAATHTLEIAENKAVVKLRHLQAARKPVLSMNAKYTLLEWEKGSLSFRKQK
jgi:hypothetical protein